MMECKNVSRVCQAGVHTRKALVPVSFFLARGKDHAVLGPGSAGKVRICTFPAD